MNSPRQQKTGVEKNTRFTVYYSYSAELMTAILFQRIDRICCFTQLLLGSAVMASVASPLLTGFILTVIAAAQFSLKPAELAVHARQHAFRYGCLVHDLDDNNKHKTIREHLKELERQDSTPLLSIRKAAYIQSLIADGEKNLTAQKKKELTFVNRFIIWLAGGIQGI